ncbi:hypothetical protein NM688_g9402 [Phlebia brevispora]|uniref:Uncharacterized protein n=1 Tax=Phlebia brevispora TaxID=194682 RepID=A0ACC1RHJ6_9APHY|nr:hypothetical protein NM688_g9402 [Phlebia brevispora]
MRIQVTTMLTYVWQLLAAFLNGSSSPQVSWPLIGVGLRLAQARGAHRKKVYDGGPTVETELLKRAFWSLVMVDRSMSSALGRPCGIQDEDFDVDLPLECDDEYWLNDDPSLAFKQPAGKPSQIAFFNCCIRLHQIHAFALRTIYSINKSKANFGRVGHGWEEQIVSELDSALNKFVDSIPEHLRWNPHQKNILFLNQSALLYAQYYNVQITVHRRFIPSPGKPSRFPFPSLAICTNAARSCVHVLDVQYQRVRKEHPENRERYVIAPISAMFNAGMVLLLNIWGGKRSGTVIDHAKEMQEVHKVMRMLKALDRRCFAGYRLWDVLCEMASMGELPLPPTDDDVPSKKRAREQSEENSPPPSQARTLEGSDQDLVSMQQTISPAYLASLDPGPSQQPQLSLEIISPSALPLSSQELGRLPVYLQVDPSMSPSVPSIMDYTSSANLAGASDQSYGQPYDQSQNNPLSPSSMYTAGQFSGNTDSLAVNDGPVTGEQGSSSAGAWLAKICRMRGKLIPPGSSKRFPEICPHLTDLNSASSWEAWESYITSVNGPLSDQPQFPSF